MTTLTQIWPCSNGIKSIARGVPTLPKHLLPFPSELSFSILNVSLDVLDQRINALLHSIHVAWQWNSSIYTGIGFAMRDVWSRTYRRQRKKMTKHTATTASAADEEENDDDDNWEINPEKAALGFKIILSMDKGVEGVTVIVLWLKGYESVLFESFGGMIKRRLFQQ